jgi:hypothetical protein
MNQAAIEIARILLEFEVERLEHQKNTESGCVSQAQPNSAEDHQPLWVNRRIDSKRRRLNRQQEA